ncbi:hypothetical protein P7H20_01250 [Paenibacillus larvae]|nr:hypothetical protein [Paenibacillus larvae]MDT2273788.1 hypothetical protein [Paenibacillus larvae]
MREKCRSIYLDPERPEDERAEAAETFTSHTKPKWTRDYSTLAGSSAAVETDALEVGQRVPGL